MEDVRRNGKQEIIFSNSNNANGSTVFTILDANGTIVKKVDVSTRSSEFDIIPWPDGDDSPHILLTEENRIRIVDMQGDTVVQLDAPGCRSFGKVEAVPVILEKDKPASLAVRKILHPDLAVLYVYDANGTLVFQHTEVTEGSLQPALAAVPADETGVERLLVGHSVDVGARVVEYSIAR